MLEVSAKQSIAIFGWWDQPRKIVTWDDLTRQNWSWRRLRTELKFTPLELFKLQKDKNAWITRGSLTLHDLPEMTIFPVNPFTDMKADLGEVWSMRWTASQLADMHVTYSEMRDRGLSPQIMSHFNFSLSSWFSLGFRHGDAQKFSDESSLMVFGVSQAELVKILSDFSPEITVRDLQQ
tara:strand:+ start:23482 stop:24018 length:537 start_codon:yes stop_codon:yes gene_type:complete